MPWYPAATKRNIPPGDNDPPIKPRIAVLHVDAGNAESLFDWFNGPSGGVESHFFVKKTGEVEQYRDTDFQADANLDANNFSLSVETQGFGEGEWTDAQLASIKALLLWMHDTHPAIPLKVCDAWDGSGIGYHVMFGSPGHWTPSAKTCPGPDRIQQFKTIITPWLDAGAPAEEDELSAEDVKNIRDDIAGLQKRVNEIATAERDRDAAEREADQRRQQALLDQGRAVMQAVSGIVIPPDVTDPAEIQAIFEQAIRQVLGSVDETGTP